MKKLLHKPVKIFTLYALLILLSSIPVYYLAVDFIWLDELDEHNQIIRKEIVDGLNKLEISNEQFEEVLSFWNQIQPGTSLKKIAAPQNEKDSIYEVIRFNSLDGDMDRFRGLSSNIQIKHDWYHLNVETNVEAADETILIIAIVTISFFVLMLLGFILLNRRISISLWKPFNQTLDKLRNFDLAKDKALSFGASDIVEFDELNQSLDKLINDNISTYNQQKAFIENASHELQTPLALLKSKLNLLLQSSELSSAQSELLNEIELPLARLSRINKNLLLLAKIENSQFNETEIIDVTTLFHENLDLLNDYMEGMGISCEVQEIDPLKVISNRYLVETMLTNLLTNAIRHSPKGGQISVQIMSQSIQISNTGLMSLDRTKLFKRFSASNTETTNSGLGLAIISEICDRYHWTIDYQFKNDRHIFSVGF